ncbi:MAG TPA: YrhB domain-containing protein [Verrucomicrobiae bacterium]|nr:YrhB domain-containing protein [Verrucomicrobiae bacterium]
MLTYEQAEILARTWVELISGGKAALMPEATRDKPYGWVFFWQSKQFIKRRDLRYSLVGNAPIIVDRFAGEIRVTGTAKSTDEYLAEYERTLPPARLSMRPQPHDRVRPGDDPNTNGTSRQPS